MEGERALCLCLAYCGACSVRYDILHEAGRRAILGFLVVLPSFPGQAGTGWGRHLPSKTGRVGMGGMHAHRHFSRALWAFSLVSFGSWTL